MLEVSHLCKSYGSARPVKDVSFSLSAHEIAGLLGPNGAGKSTTMRMLSGYLAPTSGAVTFLGWDVAEHPREAKRRLGYLPETPPLYPDMTVLEHLRFVCALRGVGRRQVKAECDRVCGLLNVSDVASRLIGRLSKGYRQRVGFAAALVGSPRLLILDEPMVGLDPEQIIDTRRLILSLSQSMALLISSHMLAEIASVCTRILIMRRGELRLDGSPAEIEARSRGAGVLRATVRGERDLAERTLRSCLAGEAQISAADGLRPGETDFLVTAGPEVKADEKIFLAVAGEAPRLVLKALCSSAPSLEDIYIGVTRDGEGAVTGRGA